MKTTVLIFVMSLLLGGCALMMANPGNKYSYPYGNDVHPCVYPCERTNQGDIYTNNGHYIYHVEKKGE